LGFCRQAGEDEDHDHCGANGAMKEKAIIREQIRLLRFISTDEITDTLALSNPTMTTAVE
jgi:hypothetical protein